MTTWSGTYTNELAGNPYQSKNGIRGILDLVADTVVDTPIGPELDSSFSLQVHNPNRHLLTINTTEQIQTPRGAGIASTVSTRVKDFVVGYTFDGTVWRIDKWMVFSTGLNIIEAAEWTPRTTPGPATIIDSIGGVTVDRTAEGFYTVTLDEPLVTTDILNFRANVTGLADEASPEIIQLTQGPTVLNLNTGYRDKQGKFEDSDLLQNPANTITIIVQALP